MTAAPPGQGCAVPDIPFSPHGSWFDISPVVAEQTLADDLHLVSHQTGMHAVLSFVPLDGPGGGRARTTVRATPSRLSWTVAGGGRIHLLYQSPDTPRLPRPGPAPPLPAPAGPPPPFR